MDGETGEKGAIGFKGTEGRPGDPGLIGIKVLALFYLEIADHFVEIFMCALQCYCFCIFSSKKKVIDCGILLVIPVFLDF